MARRWIGDGWYRALQEPGLRFTNELTIQGRIVENTRELVIQAWSIPAAQAGAYDRVATNAGQNVLTIWARERLGRIGPAIGGRLGIRRMTLAWIYLALWISFLIWGAVTSMR